jgi:hypothetical protein
VSLALVWILEAALPLIFAATACRLRQMWRATRTRVMNYPGPYALATYWALQSMRWVVPTGLVMAAAISFGWGGAVIALFIITVVLEVVAICSVGLMLPMIAIVPRRSDSAQPG